VALAEQQIVDAQELVSRVFKSLRADLLTAYGNVEHTRKVDRSPVTEWDVKVEKTLSGELAKQFPEIGFRGEETGNTGNDDTYWLVDPIDGTSSFIRGLAYSTNMAALVQGGQVIAAVVYDFVNDVLYTARKGHGAFKDGKRIAVNTKREPGNLVAYSFTRNTFGLIREALQEMGIRALLTMGAAGHSYVMLAEGKIDGLIALHTNMGAYDNAPGLLIAEEAGAVVLQYDDEEGVDRHEFVVGSPKFIEVVEHSGLI
jgi:myo-inositol-1(or 4)-monophosphatase